MKTHKQLKFVLSLFLVCALVFTLGLMAGCKGSDGGAGETGVAGPTGPTGPTGPAGQDGADLTTGTVDAASFTYDDLRNIPLGGKIISASTDSNQPVVTFQVVNKNTGEGIRGLRTFSLHIAQLQPEANGSNSYWLNYITSASSASGSFRPTTDPVSQFNSTTGALTKQGYSVIDNNDGTYVVTFAADIKSGTTATWGTTYYNPASATYDANLPHRIVVGVRSVAVPGVVGKTPGAYAGPINPVTGVAFPQFTNTNGVNLSYDFVPATGVLAAPSRDIVTIDACNQCHYKLQYGSNNTSGHFGSRTDTKTCVMCHTPQNVVTGQTATTNVHFTPFIHKIHMGEDLPAIETNLTGTLNEVTFPRDARNCATCHQGGNDSANWKNKPSRIACGSCHNNVNFATGANHSGGAQTDDSYCKICHDATKITGYHVPVFTNTDTTSGSYGVSYANNGQLPTGAYKLEYVISSVTVSAGMPSVKFQVKKDGSAVNFGTYDAAANPTLIPSTTGGPTIAFVYNMTQDNITSPADFNGRVSITLGPGNPTVTGAAPGTYAPVPAANSLWSNGSTTTASGITWTLTGPDGSNNYVVTTNTPLPSSATMLTAVIYGTFTQTNLSTYPYAAASAADFTNYTGTKWRITKPGLVIAPAIASKAFVGKDAGTGKTFVARRTIVDNAKCNACHDQLGIKPNFHGGARNDGTICNICHTPNGVNKGWSYSFNTFIHGIHASGKRTVDYTFAADWSTVTYPGLLKNCEQCHVAGSYDLSNATASSGTLLLNTVATGTSAAADANTSPYIVQTAGTPYGSGFAYTASTGTTAEAAGTTLVTSPIAAACFSCHDSSAAVSHMELNGASIYEARSAALTKTETCVICHGPASNTAYGDYVPAVKSVHRWW